MKSTKRTSVLALTLNGANLRGVAMRRTNGSLKVEKAFAATLTLDPLTAAPELVGREVRNHLDAAGIRERYCVVGLPVKWALTYSSEIPDIEEADLPEFLQLEAERGFPCDASSLQVCMSRFRAPGGTDRALFVGIPRTHLVTLEKVLKSAQLRPISFALPLARPLPGQSSQLSVLLTDANLVIEVTSNGGIAALRTLDSAADTGAGKEGGHSALVAREVRITLGQLPADVRAGLNRIAVVGSRELTQPVADELELRFEPAGFKVDCINRYSPDEFGLQLPADTQVCSAVTLAGDLLAGRPTGLEFLPPRVHPLQRLAKRYASGRWRTAGAAGLGIAALLAGLFGYQQLRLISLQAQWNRMAPTVRELEDVQSQIKQYRPWFDESARSLTILRQLSLIFPEDSSVSAKTVEIRDGRMVTCTGTARDNPALFQMQDRLRALGNVSDLKVETIRGKSPLQYTFNFQWMEGGRNEP